MGKCTTLGVTNTQINELVNGSNPSGAMDYYVDGNVGATGNGTKERPFKTLAEAVGASNTSIALGTNRWWARRNRIFCMGDVLDESLTQFPTKCDVIGVGSYDANSKCGLSGMHSSALEAYGTRWFNMHFLADAAAAPIFTLAGATSVAGQEFHSCTFDGTLGTMTSGILATASHSLVVNDCDFIGTFVTSYITFGAGECGRTKIINNRMIGTAAKGIVVGGTATATWKPVINDNFIQATGIIVDDDANIFFGGGNMLLTAADPGADSLGAMDVTAANWLGNKLTSTAGTERNADFPFQVQFTS